MKKYFRCYISEHKGVWEAICIDLDISVSDDSFEGVKGRLREAVHDYVEHVSTLPEPDRSQLLDRKSPLSVRLPFYFHSLKSALQPPRNDGGTHLPLYIAA